MVGTAGGATSSASQGGVTSSASQGGVTSSASHFYELWSMNGLALSKASPPFLVERDPIREITQMSMEYL